MLAVLAIGCGCLLERLAGRSLPGTLVAPAGFAVMIVAASFATLASATATLAVPLVVALAVGGLAAGTPWRGRRLDGWALGAALAVFAVYAAPVVLSGQATFAGYLTLDDTATWLGLTDQLLTHGRDLGSLAPSSYEAMLDEYVKQSGYPVGSFLPLGIGGRLVGTDLAWVFQPYISFAAAMLALGLYELTRRLVRSRVLRALVTFVAAQPALLYAYSQWSGVKEVVSASMIALFAGLLALTLPPTDADGKPRGLLPLGTAIAAELAALSVGGGVWLVAALLVAAVVLGLADAGLFARRAVALVGIVLALSIPALAIAGTFFRKASASSVLTSSSELGNLIRPLNHLQFFGIWPSSDFRLPPAHLGPTYVLIAVLVAAACAGLWFAWRSRAWGVLLYVSTLTVGCALLVSKGSPWVDGKAMGTASTAFLLAALAGCAVFFEQGRRVEAGVAAVAIAAGVLWSNTLTYHDVWLAPKPALAELATIGTRFAGDGPALMTEYQPYGVRHFLRHLDPESAGELRRRLIPLLSGEGVAKGGYADLDQFQTDGILVYKTHRAAALAGGEPPALELPARPARPLLRRLAAAGRQRGHPPAPPARRRVPAGGDGAVRAGGPARDARRAVRSARVCRAEARDRGEPRATAAACRLAGGLGRRGGPRRERRHARHWCRRSRGGPVQLLAGRVVPRPDAVADRRKGRRGHAPLAQRGGRVHAVRERRPHARTASRHARIPGLRPAPGKRRCAVRVRAAAARARRRRPARGDRPLGGRPETLRPQPRLDRGAGAGVISIVIPVRNGGADLVRCLDAIACQHVDGEVEVVVVDSGSIDGSAELARSRGARVEVIAQSEFGHGSARNLGAELAGGETLVFTSQDAHAIDDAWLAALCRPLADDPGLAAVYGRQLPHDGARPPERYFLDFLYGGAARTQTARTVSDLSMETTLFSNVNSAIRRSVWEEFRFADDIIMSEDQEWSARVLLAGWSVRYEPRAAVRHSHVYSVRSAFSRFFDSGVSAERAYLAGARPSSRVLRRAALRYGVGEVEWLWRSGRRRWIPYAAVYETSKFAGLQLGMRHRRLPRWLKPRLSAYPRYWRGGSADE